MLNVRSKNNFGHESPKFTIHVEFSSLTARDFVKNHRVRVKRKEIAEKLVKVTAINGTAVGFRVVESTRL